MCCLIETEEGILLGDVVTRSRSDKKSGCNEGPTSDSRWIDAT
jgi:hypothetical protein